MPTAPDTTPLPPADRDFARLGLALLRRLGVNGADAPRRPSLLWRLIPETAGRSYPSALHLALAGPDGKARPVSEADEARWLAEHLRLDALAGLDGPLGELWRGACARAGVPHTDAEVDTELLIGRLPALAERGDNRVWTDELAAAIIPRS